MTARAPGWKIRRDGWKLVAPGLDTAYGEGREAFAALGDSPGFDAVHDLRKRGKDLWYQVRLLRDAWEPVLEATAEEIHDFTDLLGDHHDLAVLAEDLDGRPEVGAAHRETLRALIEARQDGPAGRGAHRRRADLRGEAEGVRPPPARLLARLAQPGLSATRA